MVILLHMCTVQHQHIICNDDSAVLCLDLISTAAVWEKKKKSIVADDNFLDKVF